MVEYGQTVGQGTGAAGGGGGPVDVGVGLVNAFFDTVHRVAALPPGTLLLVAAVILVGLFLLRRAF